MKNWVVMISTLNWFRIHSSSVCKTQQLWSVYNFSKKVTVKSIFLSFEISVWLWLKKKIIFLLSKKLHIFLVWIYKREKHYELLTVCFLNSRGTVVSNTTLWKANVLFLTKYSLTHCRFDFFGHSPPSFLFRCTECWGAQVVL